MPLGQALLLSPLGTFMANLEARLAPRPKDSSYLDTLVNMLQYPDASPPLPSASFEKPTITQPLTPSPPQHLSEPLPLPPTPTTTLTLDAPFSITPFPPRRPLSLSSSSPYLSSSLFAHRSELPHIDLSLELRKLSAENLRKQALSSARSPRPPKSSLFNVKASSLTTPTRRSPRSRSYPYPSSPPLSSSSSNYAYDAWLATLPLEHVQLGMQMAQGTYGAPGLCLAIGFIFALALVGQLVLVWMMTYGWGVFAT